MLAKRNRFGRAVDLASWRRSLRSILLMFGLLFSSASQPDRLLAQTNAQTQTQPTESDVSSDEELLTKGLAHWERAFPNRPAQHHQTSHFLFIGSADLDLLREQGEQAETVWQQWQRWITSRDPGRDSSDADRRVVFLVNRPYELNEFALMIEQRWLPRPIESAFWKSDPKDAYLVVRTSEETKRLEASPWAWGLVGIELEQTGRYPLWYVRGLADAFAARLTPEHARVKRLQGIQATLSQQLKNPGDFLDGKTSLEITDAAACSFVQFLQRQRAAFQKAHHASAASPVDWEKQLASIYGMSLDQLVEQWWQQQAGTRKRSR